MGKQGVELSGWDQSLSSSTYTGKEQASQQIGQSSLRAVWQHRRWIWKSFPRGRAKGAVGRVPDRAQGDQSGLKSRSGTPLLYGLGSVGELDRLAFMADEALDDMLLEATGRLKGIHGAEKAGSSRRTPAKRRGPIQDDSSDDHSDSKSENDFDDDDEDDYEGGGSSRKADGSKMPLKKRLESSDKDGEEGGRDGYESELSFGSDLYKDEDDRIQLHAMTELEREMILHDRSEARDNFRMRAKASQRNKQNQVKTSQPRERDIGPPSSRMRLSVRETRETPRTAKDNALNELVARRNRNQDPDFRRKNRDASASAARERERQVSVRNNRKRSYCDIDSESDDDEESSREGDRSDRRV